MQYRRLGNSDLEVSVISFGAWQLGDPDYWGADPEADGGAAVAAALDEGITLFDTAEAYGAGASEEALGRALGPRRGDVCIASKVSADHGAPADLRAACEASLQRLGTDHIDLYQIHWPIRDVPLAEVYGELDRLRQEGKIRAVGVSNFGPLDLADWCAVGECASNQLGYNMLFRAIEHEVVPACLDHDIGILAYMPLLQGILAGRWESIDEIPVNRRRTRHFSSDREGTRHGEPGCEDLTVQALAEIRRVADDLEHSMATIAMAWLLGKPGVTSVVVGARNPRQVLRNTNAAALELPEDVIARLDAATDAVKAYFGMNCDQWQSGDDVRIR